jgi:hypothetical protein
MKCANCDADAAYLINDPGSNPQAFCTKDLPDHYWSRVQDGSILLVNGA